MRGAARRGNHDAGVLFGEALWCENCVSALGEGP